MSKSSNSMAIFNSHVNVYQRVGVCELLEFSQIDQIGLGLCSNSWAAASASKSVIEQAACSTGVA